MKIRKFLKIVSGQLRHNPTQQEYASLEYAGEKYRLWVASGKIFRITEGTRIDYDTTPEIVDVDKDLGIVTYIGTGTREISLPFGDNAVVGPETVVETRTTIRQYHPLTKKDLLGILKKHT